MHPEVIHPHSLVDKEYSHKLVEANDKALDWLSNHVLASIWLFDIALIVPLLVLPMPDSIKVTLGVISGSWIQWWALPALQRTNNKAQAQDNAKAYTDHRALTHIANTIDQIKKALAKLEAPHERLKTVPKVPSTARPRRTSVQKAALRLR